ncbi:hypothetical protein [Enterovirga sp. CN4-39]|uniref:hypothetical protein n=1 Tax=Enterovirga sp. CN4-39 TaxID=3400910 RepID=UPI003BFC4D23
MAVDIKAELTRPPALILAALAALGWVLFALSSVSATSVQKTQRLQIADLTAKNEQLTTDLARQVEASGALADLQAKVGATREELARVSQTRTDVQNELAAAQRNLQNVKRDLGDADRNLQSQSQRLNELQTNAETAEAQASDQQATSATRRGKKWSRRGRRSVSISRTR